MSGCIIAALTFQRKVSVLDTAQLNECLVKQLVSSWHLTDDNFALV